MAQVANFIGRAKPVGQGHQPRLPVTRIRVGYGLVTPAFIAGAKPTSKAELRIPSIKGALRFWWRACAGINNVKDLRQREAQLFGSASGGQSRLRIAWAKEPIRWVWDKGTTLEKWNKRGRSLYGTAYLGYGVINAQKQELTRPCIRSCSLSLDMRLVHDRNSYAQSGAAELAGLVRSIMALGLLGGIGSKSRKGFGSLVLEELTIEGATGDLLTSELCRNLSLIKVGGRSATWTWQPPVNVGQLAGRIRALYPPSSVTREGKSPPLPEWTALSPYSSHHLVPMQRGGAIEAVDTIGAELVRYRSWGKNGKILDGQPREGNFKDDHDLAKDTITGRHPRRVVFGLPHNYPRDKFTVSGPNGGRQRIDRRASPLLLHVHWLGDKPVIVVSFLPARFLPRGRERLTVERNRNPKQVTLDSHSDIDSRLWQPIHDFLARISQRFEAVEIIAPSV